MNDMEGPTAYTDQLFAQGLSYVYEVCIRFICGSVPEPLEIYLGPGKPLQLITLIFKTGRLHYCATRLISTEGSVIDQKRKRDNANSTLVAKHIKRNPNMRNSRELKATRRRPPERNGGQRRGLI